MKIALGIFVALNLAWLVAFAVMGWWSHGHGGAPGIGSGGQLAACPASPNCVCSDTTDAGEEHAIDALDMRWDESRLAAAVSSLGGVVESRGDDYLHATFTSRLFRFVDDLELRADGARVQVRSASRVGHSDLGVNRKRVAALRAALEQDGA